MLPRRAGIKTCRRELLVIVDESCDRGSIMACNRSHQLDQRIIVRHREHAIGE
jgi:hypothetical protein